MRVSSLPMILAAAVSLFVAAPLVSAEVLVLASGELLFGSVDSSTGDRLTLKDREGKAIVLKKQDVSRIEPSTDAFIDAGLEVVLKDGSVIRGLLVDYDEELGFFLDISFGTLDLPPSQIQAVYLEAMRKTRDQPSTVIGGGASMLVPIGSDQFGLSYSPCITFETKLPKIHGLYLGESLEYMVMNYTASDDVAYTIAGLSVGLTAKLLPLFTQRETTGILNPYVGLGGGPVFIRVVDKRSNALNLYYGTMNAQLRMKLGLEISPLKHFTIDAGAGACMISQEDAPFWLLSGTLIARYDF